VKLFSILENSFNNWAIPFQFSYFKIYNINIVYLVLCAENDYKCAYCQSVNTYSLEIVPNSHCEGTPIENSSAQCFCNNTCIQAHTQGYNPSSTKAM